MKTRNIVRILLVLALVCGVLAAASPAYAEGRGTYSQQTIELDLSATLDPGPENPCTIPLTAQAGGLLRMNVWTDEFGQTTHDFIFYPSYKLIVFSNVNSNIIKVEYIQNWHESYEWGSNTLTVTVRLGGTANIITIPHYGKIYGGSGLEYFITTIDFTDPENPVESTTLIHDLKHFATDWSPICEYLGGELV